MSRRGLIYSSSFLDNLNKENAGRAFLHTVATTAATAVIMDSAASALTTDSGFKSVQKILGW